MIQNGPLSICIKRFAIIDSSILSFISGLIVSTIFANALNLSFLDNFAWKYMLPASVSANLIRRESYGSITNEIKESISPMILAFLFGTVGSIIGGILNSLFFKFYLSENVTDILKVLSGLTASYIGGTANLFETAHCLQLGEKGKQILRLVAVADIGVMIVYFTILKYLHEVPKKSSLLSSDPFLFEIENHHQQQLETHPTTPKLQLIQQIIWSTLIPLVITILSVIMQSKLFNQPGVAILLVTMISSSFQFLIETNKSLQSFANQYLPLKRTASKSYSIVIYIPSDLLTFFVF
jgi:uncharacterized membrane protein